MAAQRVPHRKSAAASRVICRASPGPFASSSVLGDARDEMAQHVFVGGNAFMVRMLNRYRTELGVAALPSELDATARATIRQLQGETATLSISPLQINGRQLAFRVDVRNLTGHKFPTGYPSRRAWLHVTVRSGDALVFESGAVDGTRRDSRQRQRRRSPAIRASLRADYPAPIRSRSTSLSSEIAPERRRQDS